MTRVASTTSALGPGSRIGKYSIVREIGRGGMGSVYEARHEELHKAVAIKTLKPEFATQPAVVERFLREGRAASRVRHRHAIEMFDVGEDEGVVYLAMELLEGEDLAQRLKRGGALPAQTAIDLLLPVLSAIVEAHDVGVVHRDLKPGNIFLATTRRGHVEPKVLDFGISRIEEDQTQTSTDTMLGTPYFMAPEQVRGAKNTSPFSDQFSLGVILYQCTTGVLPFRGASSFETFQLITQGQFRMPRTLVPSIPEGVEASIVRALATEASARFPSVAEFARSLCPYASAGARALWEPTFSSGDAALEISMVSEVANALPLDPVSSQSVSTPGTLTGAVREHTRPKEAPASSTRTLSLTLGAFALLGLLSAGAGRALKGAGVLQSSAAAVTSPVAPPAAPTAAAPAAPAAAPAAPVAAPAAPVAHPAGGRAPEAPAALAEPPETSARVLEVSNVRAADRSPRSGRRPTHPTHHTGGSRHTRGPERDPSGATIVD